MHIVKDHITRNQLQMLAQQKFGNMIKAVVDVDRNLIAVDAELHSDLEALLLEQGSSQTSVWGINFYPELTGNDFVEFDSMINLRPSQGNFSRGVDDKGLRQKILGVIEQRIVS